MKKYGFFFLFILIASAIVGIFRIKPISQMVECGKFATKSWRRYSGKIKSSTALDITYAFPLRYEDGKIPDFVTADLGEHPRLHYIKYLGDGQFAEDESFPVIETEHARSILPFLIEGKHAFVVADHGVDVPPFAGGQSRVVVQEKAGWKDQTRKYFPKHRSFDFNVTDIPRADGKKDLYFGVVARKNEPSYILKNDGNDHFTAAIDILPRELQNENFCMMTAKRFPGEGPQSFIYLGACDRSGVEEKIDRDRIMVSDGKTLTLLPSENLPPREKDSSWGTVDVTMADINHDGLTDVVTAVHNSGFTQGGIQIYLNTGNMKFRSPEEEYLQTTDPKKPSFIPFVRTADLDGDGYPEVVAPVRGVYVNGQDPKLQKKFALYRNVKGENFEDVSQCLGSQLNAVSSAEFMDFDGNGKPDLLLIDFNGQYEIFYNFIR